MSGIVRYALVQVVPDPVRGERLNVGVIAWDEEHREGVVRIPSPSGRLKAIGIEDTAFIRHFKRWAEEAVAVPEARLFAPEGALAEPWSLELMERAAREWGGMIQLTEPRASRGTPAQVAREVEQRAVVLGSARQSSATNRDTLRTSVARSIRASLSAKYSDSKPLSVRTSHEVKGALDPHVFDVAVLNGAAKCLIFTPNLRAPRLQEVSRDLDAAAWAVSDVSKAPGNAASFAILKDPGATERVRTRVNHLASALPLVPVERAELTKWVETVAV